MNKEMMYIIVHILAIVFLLLCMIDMYNFKGFRIKNIKLKLVVYLLFVVFGSIVCVIDIIEFFSIFK